MKNMTFNGSVGNYDIGLEDDESRAELLSGASQVDANGAFVEE